MMRPNGWLVQFRRTVANRKFFAISRTSGPIDRTKHQLRTFPEKECMTKHCTAKSGWRWSTNDEEDDI